MLEKTIATLEGIRDLEIKISDTKNGECIHQTQRNKIGAILRNALVEDFKEIFPASDEPTAIVAYLTDDGLVLEIPNGSVKDNITNVEGSGAITVKNLHYNAQDKSDAYAVDLAEKMAKEQEKAEKKAKKIAKDTATRAKKKGEG